MRRKVIRGDRRILTCIVWAGVAICSSVRAEVASVTISGPGSPVVFDAGTRSARPIVGIPGSAYLGAPVLHEIESFAARPDGSAFLGIRNGRLIFIAHGNAGPAHWRETEIGDIPSGVTGVAWSTDGSVAAAWSADRVYLLRCCSGGLTPARHIVPGISGERIYQAIPGGLSRVVIATAGEHSGALYFVNGGEPGLLMQTETPAHLVSNGDRVYASDRAGRRVIDISMDNGTAVPLVEAGHGISDPVASAVSSDGKWLYVLSRSDRTLQVYDIALKKIAGNIEVEFEPCGVERIRRADQFLIETCAPTAPLLILQSTPRSVMYFLPRSREN